MFVIIVGGGKIGAYLAALLTGSGVEVKVIEQRQEEIPALERDLPAETVLHGSGTDPKVLEAAGARDADVVAAVTGADETNLVIAGLAHSEFRVPRVIARVNDPNNVWMFNKKMGVDAALNQADLLAHLIAEEISLGEVLTLLKLNKGDYSLVEEKVHPLSEAAGKAIRDVALPADCIIAAVIRDGKLLVPRGGVVLQPEDEVLAVIHSSEAAGLAALLGPAQHRPAT